MSLEQLFNRVQSFRVQDYYEPNDISELLTILSQTIEHVQRLESLIEGVRNAQAHNWEASVKTNPPKRVI